MFLLIAILCLSLAALITSIAYISDRNDRFVNELDGMWFSNPFAKPHIDIRKGHDKYLRIKVILNTRFIDMNVSMAAMRALDRCPNECKY